MVGEGGVLGGTRGAREHTQGRTAAGCMVKSAGLLALRTGSNWPLSFADRVTTLATMIWFASSTAICVLLQMVDTAAWLVDRVVPEVPVLAE